MNTATLHAAGAIRVVLHFRLRSEDEKGHWNWTWTDAGAETEEGGPQLVMCDSFQQRANIGAPNSWLGCRSISGRQGATLVRTGKDERTKAVLSLKGSSKANRGQRGDEEGCGGLGESAWGGVEYGCRERQYGAAGSWDDLRCACRWLI